MPLQVDAQMLNKVWLMIDEGALVSGYAATEAVVGRPAEGGAQRVAERAPRSGPLQRRQSKLVRWPTPFGRQCAAKRRRQEHNSEAQYAQPQEKIQEKIPPGWHCGASLARDRAAVLKHRGKADRQGSGPPTGANRGADPELVRKERSAVKTPDTRRAPVHRHCLVDGDASTSASWLA